MEASPPWRRSGVFVALLALAASAASLANGFVYDDIPIVLQNPLVHHAEMVGRIWTTPYWPAGLLYRPLTIQGFSLQWALGGGSPLAFHAASALLMVLVALLFWRLARRILPQGPAVLASALFAVHPVHVESVANAVGQAELLATAFTLVVLERYLVWRAAGPLSGLQRWALAVLTLLAILSKETGFVIPALLVAAEVLLAAPLRLPWRERIGLLTPVLVLQGAAVLAAILARIIVLGPTPGAGPAVALQGLAPVERVTGMLAVVPQWARLLLWPAHLQAEYGPPAIAVTGPFGAAHAFGVLLLLAFVGILVITWRRHPVIAFGLGCVGIALFPVSNVLTVTGVILAERTLFLPSAGAMLGVGGGLALLGPRLAAARAPFRTAAALLIGVVILAGVLRSIERQPVWKDSLGFMGRLETDGPTTYRAQLMASVFYAETGRLAAAERAGARAYELFKGDPQVFEQYGQTLRRQRRCREALPVLADGVRRFPDRTVMRSRLIECALATGDSTRARRVAAEAVRLGQPEFDNTVRRLTPGARSAP